MLLSAFQLFDCIKFYVPTLDGTLILLKVFKIDTLRLRLVQGTTISGHNVQYGCLLVSVWKPLQQLSQILQLHNAKKCKMSHHSSTKGQKDMLKE